MSLEGLWEQYTTCECFNKDCLPKELMQKGIMVSYKAGSTIIYAGDYPEYVYFICTGIVQGKRQYNDGNDYYYFTLNSKNGSVGLLEIFSKQRASIATITAKTDVTALKISSSVLYEYIITDIEALRRCLHVVSYDLYERSGNDGRLYYMNGLNRVKHFLIEYYDAHVNHPKETVEIGITYDIIGNHIGVSTRTVGRSMKELKEKGLVHYCKKKFFLSYEQYDNIKKELRH